MPFRPVMDRRQRSRQSQFAAEAAEGQGSRVAAGVAVIAHITGELGFTGELEVRW